MKIFHYTSLSSFEKILISKKIRFTNLSYVNDKYEGETQDIGNIGKYIFISCWTLKQSEDSLMWEMYGDNNRGVRIGMELPIFNLSYDSQNNPSIISLEGEFLERCMLLPAENGKYFIEIKYTDLNIDLKPRTLFNLPTNGISGFTYGAIGKCKSTKWHHENENRFIVYSLPIVNKEDFIGNTLNAIAESIRLMRNNFDIGMKYIDIKLNTDSFSGMIIHYGEKITSHDKERLYSIVNKSNPIALIKKSSI